MAASIRRGVDPEYAHIYSTVDRWKESSLRNGTSLLDANLVVWAPDTIDEVYSCFVESGDQSDRSFWDKLEDQMLGAGQAACLFMAELLYIHLLPLTNVNGDTKVSFIEKIGGWAPEPFVMPEYLKPATTPGIFHGGAGYNTGRFVHMRFLIRFARQWVQQTTEERAAHVADPWAFKTFLYDRPPEGAISQRNALLLMLFPLTFEDISSRQHKKRIVSAYPDHAGDSADIDRQILSIREAKTPEYGNDFSWYNESVRPNWDDTAKNSSPSLKSDLPADALKNHTSNSDEQRLFAETMADAITTANKVNTKSWSLTFRNNSFYLNIGPNRMMGLSSSGLAITISSSSAVELSANLKANNIEAVVSDTTFVFPKNARFCNVGKNHITKLLNNQRAYLLDTCHATAERDTPYWKSHSREALDAIREASGHTLPDIPERTGSKEKRAWITHVKRDKKSDATTSIAQGDMRIFWQINVPADSTLAVIKEALQARDPEISNHSLGNQAGSIHRFITQAQPADLVLMPDGSELYVGTITSDASYDDEHKTWARSVDWVTDPIDRSSVSPALYSRLRSLLTITEITELLPEMQGYVSDTEVDEDTPVNSHDVRLTQIDNDTAKDWMLDREWLAEIIELVQRKRQLIFFGPPGTGKTYLAEKLARYLTSESGNYQLVQFHPSYSYEDFVEGFRPQVDEKGNLTYALTPGPLKLLAEAARNAPDEPFFLIIDEINRGNLAKIFGELYYLLEYREQSLVLQYGSGSDDLFSLPKNLFVIGTMNTADRSIAMVDAAIRRRFNFVEFSPTEKPISDLLSTWLKHHEMSNEPARLLTELNRRLDDDDYAIGPSYLMNDDTKSQAGLERIWKYSILPLLAEHFYGQRNATDKFRLEELQKAITTPNTSNTITDLDTGDEGVD